MDTDKHGLRLPEGELTHTIIAGCFEVLNTLGHGLHEKPYESALAIELSLRALTTDRQARFPVVYKGHQVSEYVPDLIVENRVIIDTKVIDRITDQERGQMLNYLRIARLRVGLIVNFKKPKLEWERVIL